MGSSTEDCKLGSFQDASCAGDAQDSKSKSSGVLSFFTAHVRSDCSDVKNTVSGVPQQLRIGNDVAGCRFTLGRFASSAGLGMSETDVYEGKGTPRAQTTSATLLVHSWRHSEFYSSDVDNFPTNIPSGPNNTQLFFEDSLAIIQNISKGRCLNLRHVTCTHRFD